MTVAVYVPRIEKITFTPLFVKFESFRRGFASGLLFFFEVGFLSVKNFMSHRPAFSFKEAFSALLKVQSKGIEWSLRPFASTRALRPFLRARVVIKFVLRAASSLENITGEQRTLHKCRSIRTCPLP